MEGRKRCSQRRIIWCTAYDSLLVLSFGRLVSIIMCVYRERAIVSCYCWPCAVVVICEHSNEDVENSSSKNELWPLLDYC